MILVDLNQVLISNLMAQTRGEVTADVDMIRHMVMNSLRNYNKMFKKEYGAMVLCSDASDPWRRQVFPLYKYSRRKGREDDQRDWSEIFNILHSIKQELKDNFPYVVLTLDNTEADDIIAVMVKEAKEKVMIISGDKDFIQLQKYTHVKQYAPIQKKMVGEDIDPVVFLREQIIKGDRSDGIPNILSEDDIFTTDKKQAPITKKRLLEWSNIDNIPLGSETKKYYERNKQLIDLDEIPDRIYNNILNEYKSYKVNDRSQLLTYFIENKLKVMIENISDF
jgi:5'-3' exonuclease